MDKPIASLTASWNPDYKKLLLTKYIIIQIKCIEKIYPESPRFEIAVDDLCIVNNIANAPFHDG